ncbi:unnamed protein product [Haemonchus placei]|uniref:Recep_L_domain domain-containing protein n=1 Tax=Haemonchus placei TaxID=6290 RepID=A0A0N4WBG5_HAEPC|nr:unnamed protein product [Haemonchus placei]
MIGSTARHRALAYRDVPAGSTVDTSITTEVLLTYDVENMLITFMAIIAGLMILYLIAMIVIRVHYKACAEEMLHELETQHQAKKGKTPSPFAMTMRKDEQEKDEYVPVSKMRDGHHALYWKGDQVAAILHHAALAPVLPTLEQPEKNVEISNYRNTNAAVRGCDDISRLMLIGDFILLGNRLQEQFPKGRNGLLYFRSETVELQNVLKLISSSHTTVISEFCPLPPETAIVSRGVCFRQSKN